MWLSIEGMSFTVGVYFENSAKDRQSFKKKTCLGSLCSYFEEMADGFENLKIIDIPDSGGDVPPRKPSDLIYMFGLSPENKYIDFMGSAHQTIEFDDKAGIQSGHWPELWKHFEHFPGIPASEKYVVFDWDRTLTVIEGLADTSNIRQEYFPEFKINKAFLDSFREDTLHVLFGGPVRLAKIRTQIQSLIDEGITLFILTNNGACGRRRGDIFNELAFDKLVQKLHPYFAPLEPGVTDPSNPSEHIVCAFSRDIHDNKNPRVSKKDALENSRLFKRGYSRSTGDSKRDRGGYRRTVRRRRSRTKKHHT